MPVVLATWEAEVEDGFSPEDGGCSEPRLCHRTPAWAIEPKTNKQTNKKPTGTDKQQGQQNQDLA